MEDYERLVGLYIIRLEQLLEDFIREYGRRAGKNDLLVPIEEQDNELVAKAMKLLNKERQMYGTFLHK